MPRQTNGWREGHDPVQRWLRIVTTVVVLGVFVVLSVGEHRNDDILILVLALGAVLLLLGYEGVVRLPFLSKDDDDERKLP